MADQSTYPYGYRPIQQPPRIVPSGTLPERERQRAANRRQQQRNMRSYKVLLIGESGVGKSTLVARLCEDRFLTEGRQYTLGFDMFEKEIEVDGEKIKVYLWDTVGAERFDSITTQYYRGGAGMIVVYDITGLQSFAQLPKWMGYVQMHATAEVSVMLLGSKVDLEGRREVATEEGQKFADHHDIKFFFEVSAKTGDGIDDAFTAFFKEIHRKAQPRSQDDPKPSNDSNESKCPC